MPGQRQREIVANSYTAAAANCITSRVSSVSGCQPGCSRRLSTCLVTPSGGLEGEGAVVLVLGLEVSSRTIFLALTLQLSP